MEEEEATQQATQQVIDPRRLGQANSGLSNEDLADIFCILHPASLPAHKAAAVIRELTPQHTISTQDGVKIRERDSDSQIDPGTFELAEQGLSSCDIVLRLSATLKNPAGGYTFGRNKSRCDFVLGQDEDVKRISNTHFRIYINEYGIIMLEDQSTNGTAVDGVLLRAKDKENGRDYRHTLEQGSIIILTMTPPEEDFRFIVRVPQRDDDSDVVYRTNLTNYFHRINIANLERQRQARGNGIGQHEPPNLFATPDVGTPEPPLSNVGTFVREWRGGIKYNKVATIGKGAFATVYKMTAKFDGVPYAAKELEKRRFMKNGVLDQKIDNEMKIMQKIKHPNVIQYVEHVDWKEYLYIIMEYVPGGDLGSLIHRRGYLPEPEVSVMASQLLSALEYLHGKGITHRDVKPDNILIHKSDPLQVKLTDFGLSKMVDSEETFLRTFCGTLLYCAPEVYSEYREYDHHTGQRTPRGVSKKSLPPQRYDDAVDIWSLAGVLFYALSGSPPYPVKNGTTYQELLNHIMTKPLDIRPLQQCNVSETGIKFVRSMLHKHPEHRATIKELERSPWLRGVGNIEISIEDDEVDMVGDGTIDPQLHSGASQLSIHDNDLRQIKDSQSEADLHSVSDLTEIRPREIPSSFTDENSNSSFGFTEAPTHQNNARLFGEVAASALGSSGALSHLPFPVPTVNRTPLLTTTDDSQDAKFTQSGPLVHSTLIEDDSQRTRSAAVTMTMPPPPHPAHNNANDTIEIDARDTRSSSLLGAESLVGNLNMHSPASAASPTPDAPTPPSTAAPNPTVSLRRPREDDYEEIRGQPWAPADLPPKRRRVSAREIEMLLPHQVFWDAKDRSTHHFNYPRMYTSDLQHFEKYAKEKGELFEHGQKTFDATMQSFRSSRSASLEPDAARALSEPFRDDRHALMKRDERKLGDDLVQKLHTIEPKSLSQQDHLMPRTAPGSVQSAEKNIDYADKTIPNFAVQPVIGNDFQIPKRILAKFIATTDCCLPTLNLNITDNLTSWGRGQFNTARYASGQEVRIPKYAFKLLLFKRGIYQPNSILDINDEEMTFYLSTKSLHGIRVNGNVLQGADPKEPLTASKYWIEIRNGDIVTVHQSDMLSSCTKFRFVCYWGRSKTSRTEREPLQLVSEELATEIDTACSTQEKFMLAAIQRRGEQEQKLREQERQARKSQEQRQVNVNQSFSGQPASAQ